MAEFFQVKTVREVRDGFRPEHRVDVELVDVASAGGRVAAREITAAHDLPGFARSAVDGYAVRASDTFGASEAQPAYLDVVGEVAMGAAPTVSVSSGGAVEIPTGGALPDGADAIVMIEHTARVQDDRIEITRPAAAGDHVTGASDDAAAGTVLVRPGRELRPQDLGVLAASGVAVVEVFARPVVAIVSTGDEVVPPETATLAPGQVRDANTAALSALIAELGGEAHSFGIVADDPSELEKVCREALDVADILIVSAGSSVGARDATAHVAAKLGDAGVWCHGISIKPGKPTLLAEVGDGKPVIGLPGNPLSALVVMRLVGGPIIAAVAGRSEAPRLATRTATLDRNVASSTGRFDVVQVRLDGDNATPIFGRSSQLTVLTRADGFFTIDEEVQGLAAGATVTVECYR